MLLFVLFNPLCHCYFLTFLSGRKPRIYWEMIGCKGIVELFSSMQISTRGCHGERWDSYSKLHLVCNCWFFMTADHWIECLYLYFLRFQLFMFLTLAFILAILFHAYIFLLLLYLDVSHLCSQVLNELLWLMVRVCNYRF